MKKKDTEYSAEQLAVLLNISEFTVKKLAREKELPCEYINGQPMFNLNNVLAHFRKVERGAV